ncbi:unnamed protein product [Lupinus luteus]|uniref:non-specific serine/threonine protein kinase n=1 Tax=Lupinus luteus TaxID=3873 RepID=A0AAV1W5C4_LUPLU
MLNGCLSYSSIFQFLQDSVMQGLRIHGYALVVSFCFIIIIAASQRIHPSEGNALIEIKKSLIDPKENLRKWNKGDPCTSNWTGVWCFDEVGDDGYFHVRELYLMTLNLSGSLAPQLGQLSHLMILNFMWNNLTGTIPKEIGNLASLKLLLLNGNNLSGKLPDELGNLPKLNRIQVDQNQLSGPIPESFSNLINVEHIHMYNNSFSGQIPPILSNLHNLRHLLMDNNNLSGYLPPEFSMLQNLRILQLDNNNFSGNGIPSTYANLPRLAKLSLRNCTLQGAIPNFSSTPKLRFLLLNGNNLSGKLPDELGNLSELKRIQVDQNQLSGPIPESFSNLMNVRHMSLKNNNLSGSVPASIWQSITFGVSAKLLIDLCNNLLLDVSGSLNPPENVTLRLSGNPICINSNMQNIGEYCKPEEHVFVESTNSTVVCPVQACPVDNFYEYVPSSPVPCFCAAPLRIGYRLKSPSFSYFPPYRASFQSYITQSLNMDFYQLSIETYSWEEGSRLNMYLKVFPKYNDSRSSVFNVSEVRRIEFKFSSWNFLPSDIFGPYELLNFTLLGPYDDVIIDTTKRTDSKGILVASTLAAIAFVLAISALIFVLISRRRVNSFHRLSRKASSISIKIDGLKAFTLKELARATDKFNNTNKIGQGGYGNVYKGILSDETFVAVKRAEEGSLQGQKEFLTEIELLSRLHHRNLVSLIGYCNEAGEQMLVYEFMPNGTLRDWISAGRSMKKESLSFGMRLQIAKGVAKGILYLHTEADPPIFHRDIKSTNILLDSNFIAKVADFGLSRLAPILDDEGHLPNYVSTIVKGTPGYVDPEYLMTHKLTDKSDVYSVGIVYLELLTGMQPITHGKNIVREVNIARQSGMIYSIIDSGMGFYESGCLDKFLNLALSCCEDNPELRPSMVDVVRELEDIIAMFPETNDTNSCSYSTSSDNSSGKVVPSSSSLSSTSSDVTRENQQQQQMTWYVSGSDLVSGVVPTIVPR